MTPRSEPDSAQFEHALALVVVLLPWLVITFLLTR
jgi:hypothetical protein